MAKETLIWQDPMPAVDHPLIDDKDIAALKAKVLASGLTIPQLVSTAWASASTFCGGDKRGIFTERPEPLFNDFFVNLLGIGTNWQKSSTEGVLEGRDRVTGEPRWTGCVVDLVFGSNAQLRSLAEVYASDDAQASSCVASWRPGTR